VTEFLITLIIVQTILIFATTVAMSRLRSQDKALYERRFT
jgi:hypothetical protein